MRRDRLNIAQTVGTANPFLPTDVRVVAWHPTEHAFVAMIKHPRKPAEFILVQPDGSVAPWDVPKQVHKASRKLLPETAQWSPSGKLLLFTTALEGTRTSSSAGDLWRYDIQSQRTQRLTSTRRFQRRPQFSPDSTHIAFVRSDELWVMEADGSRQRQLSASATNRVYNGRCGWVYEEELHQLTCFRWLMDGSGLVFLRQDERNVPKMSWARFEDVRGGIESSRYPKAGDPNPETTVGFAVNGKVVYIDPREHPSDYLFDLQVAPNREVFVQRMPRTQQRIDLLAIDPISMEIRVVHSESAQAGWVDPRGPIKFLGDDRFLWISQTSERGRLEVRALSGAGEPVVRDFDCDLHAVDGILQGKVLVTLASPSPCDRTLHILDPKTGAQRVLGPEAGVSSAMVSPTGARVMVTSSSLHEPPVVTLYDGEGHRLVQWEHNLELEALARAHARPQIRTIPGPDGAAIYARIFKPSGRNRRKAPAFMSNYGGPNSQGVLNQWHASSFDRYLAQQGFVVAAFDNRGTASRGRAWRQCTRGRLNVLEADDQALAASWLAQQSWVDGKRMGIFGWSYGGMMALSCVLRHTKVWRCAVAVAPVTDWRLYDSVYTERFMGLPSDNVAGYEETNLTALAGNLESSLLLIHGGADDNVHLHNTMQFAEALQAKGKRFELMIYPHGRHGLEPSPEHVFGTIAAFLERELRPEVD